MKTNFLWVHDNLGTGKIISGKQLLAWCILRTMSMRQQMNEASGEESDIVKIFYPDPDGKELDIRLTVNGVEVPLEAYFDRIFHNIQEEVEESATELFEARMSERMDSFIDVMKEVQDLAIEKFRKLGISPKMNDNIIREERDSS
jgi:hypothetical protein